MDQDNRRTSPNEPITQGWVREAEKIIPKDIKNKCIDNCFSTEGIIDDAASYYKITLPIYPLNICNNNADCADDSVCVLEGAFNQGQNTCVKQCQKNSDCGAAHTCRYQCVKGENGCPETSEKICIPDMLDTELKDPNSFVGFNDFDITRRQAIEKKYPEFVVDYEKQPCFAGCSVSVIEQNHDYYYAYITHGSGVPIGKASCFKIDSQMNVTRIGEFPSMADSYIGYRNVDPKTCKGIK